jgi:uncharacterized membrane protein YqaE (UPF0057 family)
MLATLTHLAVLDISKIFDLQMFVPPVVVWLGRSPI